jgi:uncharacterized phage-like protein YoqJ
MHTIAFTGHRPKDLPGTGYLDFRDALDMLVKGRTDLRFIVGGALGTDTWAAEYALSHHIPYTLVTPFDLGVMSQFWNPTQRECLRIYAEHATDHITICSGEYDIRAYQARNEYMVDHADVVFAVYNGKRGGGTYNCIRYALAQGKPVYNLWPLNGRLRIIREV